MRRRDFKELKLPIERGMTAEASDAFRMAEICSNRGLYWKAINFYKEVLNIDPSLDEISTKIEVCYKELGLKHEDR